MPLARPMNPQRSIRAFAPFTGPWTGAWFLSLLLIVPAYPQRNGAAFGLCTETPVNGHVSGLAVRPAFRSVPAEIAIVSSRDTGLRIYTLDPSARWSSRRPFEFDSPRRSIRAVDIDGDGDQEYLTLSTTGRELSILRRRQDEFRESRIGLAEEADVVRVADLNNDRRTDLLLCGQSMAGVTCLWRNRSGGFDTRSTLFRDLSASDISVTDLNGDGISDILLVDWLKDRLILFFGISDTVFSEQVSVDLPGEPRGLAIAEVRPGISLRAALTLPEREVVFVYTVNAAGEFFLDESIVCPARPGEVAFVDVTNDGLADVLTATDSGFVVSVARSRSRFAPPIVYGVSSLPGAWRVADVDGDRRRDLVLADPRNRRILVALNAGATPSERWPAVYLAGVHPAGVVVTDADRDGNQDIAVVNAGSASLGVFRGDGAGMFKAAVNIPLPDQPQRVTALPGEPGLRPVLIVEHPFTSRIVLVEVSDKLAQSGTSSIITGPWPSILLSGRARTGTLWLFVRTGNPREGSLSASMFEQIAPDRFLERQFHMQRPTRITALAAGDFTGAGRHDLVFTMGNQPAGGNVVYRAARTLGNDYASVSTFVSLPRAQGRLQDLATADVDGDGKLDVVLLPSVTDGYSLGIAYGGGPGTAADSVVWIPGIRPATSRMLAFQDVNGDGRIDIVALDTDYQAILVSWASGARSFSAPVWIADGSSVTGFAVASLGSGITTDLVIARGARGTVSVRFNPFEGKTP